MADFHTWVNRGERLVYRGGVDGEYVRISADGRTAQRGTYTGALPHIGEALFQPTGAPVQADDGQSVERALWLAMADATLVNALAVVLPRGAYRAVARNFGGEAGLHSPPEPFTYDLAALTREQRAAAVGL